MTGKKKAVLRTAFPGDVFQVDGLEITSDGTEVDASKVEGLVEKGRANGVRLFEVDQEAAEENLPAVKENEGSGA